MSSKEATPLDFSGVQLGSKLEFGVEDSEGFMFGYSELKIPNSAFEKNETEVFIYILLSPQSLIGH